MSKFSSTATEIEYEGLQNIIMELYKSKPNPNLRRVETFMYAAHAFLTPMPGNFLSLEASRTWLFFWNTITIKVLGGAMDEESSSRLVKSLARLQYDSNNMQGWLGSDYIPHLASTYAAIHALCHVGTTDAFDLLNVDKLLNYFVAVKSESGGFLMHIDGELDVRGTYCVLSSLDLLQAHKKPRYVERITIILRNVVSFLVTCQTHQGGFGSLPGLEAHGGYTHVAVMSLYILEKWSAECLPELSNVLPKFHIEKVIKLNKLKKWCAYRVDHTGGISGRSHKLVDVCYSLWIGSLLIKLNVFPTATNLTNVDELSTIYPNINIYDRLQMYVKLISASPIRDQASPNFIKQGGGFRDKPNKGADYYHTGYGLAGLSCFQHKAESLNLRKEDEKDQLEKMSILHNCRQSSVDEMMAHFNK